MAPVIRTTSHENPESITGTLSTLYRLSKITGAAYSQGWAGTLFTDWKGCDASARWRVLKGDLPVLTTRKPSEEIRGRRTKCKNEPVSHPSLDGSWHLTLILLALSHPSTKGSNQVGVACAVIDPLFFVERIINQSFCLKWLVGIACLFPVKKCLVREGGRLERYLPCQVSHIQSDRAGNLTVLGRVASNFFPSRGKHPVIKEECPSPWVTRSPPARVLTGSPGWFEGYCQLPGAHSATKGSDPGWNC